MHVIYFEAKHVDTLALVTDAYRDDMVIEGGCLRENAPPYNSPMPTCRKMSKPIFDAD